MIFSKLTIKYTANIVVVKRTDYDSSPAVYAVHTMHLGLKQPTLIEHRNSFPFSPVSTAKIQTYFLLGLTRGPNPFPADGNR